MAMLNNQRVSPFGDKTEWIDRWDMPELAMGILSDSSKIPMGARAASGAGNLPGRCRVFGMT